MMTSSKISNFNSQYNDDIIPKISNIPLRESRHTHWTDVYLWNVGENLAQDVPLGVVVGGFLFLGGRGSREGRL